MAGPVSWADQFVLGVIAATAAWSLSGIRIELMKLRQIAERQELSVPPGTVRSSTETQETPE